MLGKGCVSGECSNHINQLLLDSRSWLITEYKPRECMRVQVHLLVHTILRNDLEFFAERAFSFSEMDPEEEVSTRLPSEP